MDESKHHNVDTMVAYQMERATTSGKLRTTLFLAKGSLVKCDTDAIVNAANTGCQGGGGIDGVISKLGGPVLREAREKLPIYPGTMSVRCPTGEAVITPAGGDLKSKWVIHAVAPNYKVQMSRNNYSFDKCDSIVRGAYRSAIKRAEEHHLSTVAFSLMGTGVFRGQQKRHVVMRNGIQGIEEGIYRGLEDVIMVAFNDEEAEDLKLAASEYFASKNNPQQLVEQQQQQQLLQQQQLQMEQQQQFNQQHQLQNQQQLQHQQQLQQPPQHQQHEQHQLQPQQVQPGTQ